MVKQEGHGVHADPCGAGAAPNSKGWAYKALIAHVLCPRLPQPPPAAPALAQAGCCCGCRVHQAPLCECAHVEVELGVDAQGELDTVRHASTSAARAACAALAALAACPASAAA